MYQMSPRGCHDGIDEVMMIVATERYLVLRRIRETVLKHVFPLSSSKM